MPVKDFPSVLELKDPLHGYISLSELERSIMDLRIAQRLRNIRSPAGVRLVFPGADSSLMGGMLGVMHVTEIFVEYLGGDLEEVLKARLAAMLLTLSTGPWDNVMKEYLAVRGIDRAKLAGLIVQSTSVKDLIQDSMFSVKEAIDLTSKGVPVKGIRLNLLSTPINPELVDSLERDAYFAGVEYAQMEFRRLFGATRIAKNKIALERGSIFTLESYLTAALNMFVAVYYHKTVRAAELMLLRILDEAGSRLFASPMDDIDNFLLLDDISFDYVLVTVGADEQENMRRASQIFCDYRKRYLVKLASERAISDEVFLNKISTPDGLFNVENEIAEEADIDPRNVYVDYPDRPSVSYYPGKNDLDDLVLYERGSKGYEFWPVAEHSGIARSFGRDLRTIRIYTTRGYRTKVKKQADMLLESIDGPGSPD
jgi:HD superfamily phosphohydrolase